jgi:putative copper export protein
VPSGRQTGELSFRRIVFGRLGRLAVYGALTIAIGAIGVGLIVVPRLRSANLPGQGEYPTVLDGMALTVGVVAGFLLALSTVVRTILQYGDTRAEGASLSLWAFLTATSVGNALALSTILGVVVAVSAAMARRLGALGMWRAVESIAVIAFIYFWASSGHASAAVSLFGISAYVPLVAHVLAAALWTGGLAVIFVTVLPVALREQARAPLLVATVRSFLPIAWISASLMVLTGVWNVAVHSTGIADLGRALYSRTLIFKVAIVVVLLLVGLYEWRVVTPRLADQRSTLRLRSTIRLELLLAAAALVVTSVLVATNPPR